MRLIILGAGGHGKVVADLAEQTGKYDAVYFLDDVSENPCVLGKCSDFEQFNAPDTEMYPAFGNNEGRIEWEKKIENAGIKLAKIIHPLAYISPKAHIDDGCVIMPYATINTGTVLHKACIVYIPFQVNHLHGQTEPVPRRMRATLTETEPMLFYANYQATAC